MGFIETDVSQVEDYQVALKLKSEAEAVGRRVEIVGNGTYSPTLQEVHDRIAAIREPVEVYLSAHGSRDTVDTPLPKNSPYAFLNNDLMVTIGTGKKLGGNQTVEMEGHSLPLNVISTISQVFEAMPPNVSGMTVSTCYSGLALKQADKLPKGARLYVVTDEQQMLNGSAGIAALAGYNRDYDQLIANGNGLDDMNANYVAHLPKKYIFDDGSEVDVKAPAIFAISRQGSFDTVDLMHGLKAHHYSPESIAAISSMLAHDKSSFQGSDPVRLAAEGRTYARNEAEVRNNVTDIANTATQGDGLDAISPNEVTRFVAINNVGKAAVIIVPKRNVMIALGQVEIFRYAESYHLTPQAAVEAMAAEDAKAAAAAAPEAAPVTPAENKLPVAGIDIGSYPALACVQNGFHQLRDAAENLHQFIRARTLNRGSSSQIKKGPLKSGPFRIDVVETTSFSLSTLQLCPQLF